MRVKKSKTLEAGHKVQVGRIQESAQMETEREENILTDLNLKFSVEDLYSQQILFSGLDTILYVSPF